MIINLRKKSKKHPKNIFCHWCGSNSEDKWDIRQNFKVLHNCIVATPSKYSKYDGKKLELSLCNKHMDELFDFLAEKCDINPIIDNIGFITAKNKIIIKND